MLQVSIRANTAHASSSSFSAKIKKVEELVLNAFHSCGIEGAFQGCIVRVESRTAMSKHKKEGVRYLKGAGTPGVNFQIKASIFKDAVYIVSFPKPAGMSFSKLSGELDLLNERHNDEEKDGKDAVAPATVSDSFPRPPIDPSKVPSPTVEELDRQIAEEQTATLLIISEMDGLQKQIDDRENRRSELLREARKLRGQLDPIERELANVDQRQRMDRKRKEEAEGRRFDAETRIGCLREERAKAVEARERAREAQLEAVAQLLAEAGLGIDELMAYIQKKQQSALASEVANNAFPSEDAIWHVSETTPAQEPALKEVSDVS